MTTKDEALKMAIEQMNVYAHIHLCEHQCQDEELLDVIQACIEALEQPLTKDWKETIDERIAKDDKFKEALAQLAQEPVSKTAERDYNFMRDLAIGTEDILNEMLLAKPVAWMHRHAGEITEFNDFQSCQYCEPLYTHPAPSWQGLSLPDIEAIRLKTLDAVATNYEAYRAIEQALKEKNNVS